jgi:hypothetical protein
VTRPVYDCCLVHLEGKKRLYFQSQNPNLDDSRVKLNFISIGYLAITVGIGSICCNQLFSLVAVATCYFQLARCEFFFLLFLLG